MDDCLRHPIRHGRRDDDVKIGIKSTAILFGRWDKRIIGLLQLATLSLLVALGQGLALGTSYYWGLLIAAGCLLTNNI